MQDAVIGFGFLFGDVALVLMAMRIVVWRERKIWVPTAITIGLVYIAANLTAYFVGVPVSDLYPGWLATAFVGLIAARILPALKAKVSPNANRKNRPQS
ncbi:MAG: hypothetical protein ACRES7_08110 [Gammaproteobacteria bacterium]